MSQLALFGTAVIYIIGSLLGLAILYFILKNAIKNGIVEADQIIRSNKIIEESEENKDSDQ